MLDSPRSASPTFERGAWWVEDRPGAAIHFATVIAAGGETWHLGDISAWPDGVDVTAEAYRTWWEQAHSRRLDDWSPGPDLQQALVFLRASDEWEVVTFEVDVNRRRVVTWRRPLPIAYTLIEFHRGRGTTDILVDISAVLALLVALSGVVHGMRYPGRRRRLLAALLVGSTVLVGALLAD